MATVTIASAPTLMPETGKEIDDNIMVVLDPESEPKELYRALKTEAALNNIIFSRTPSSRRSRSRRNAAR